MSEATTSNGLTRFAGKVSLIAGAALAVYALGNVLSGLMVTHIVKPVVAEERAARVAGDSTLAVQISNVSFDRVAILAALEYPPGRERRAALARYRAVVLQSIQAR